MKTLFHGRALYAESSRIWVARGMTFFAIDLRGKRVTPKYRVGNPTQRILSCHRIPRQLLREGIHHLLPLRNGDFFVTAKRKSFTVGGNGEIRAVFTGYTGNKPAHQGVCVTPEGSIFFGEYSVNLDHGNETILYRSTDNGLNFERLLVFPKNIRHIHFIKFDPYEKCLWLGTGDADDECHLMKSSDNGDTWEMIGSGSQNWRAIGVCFTPDALIWGTDAGSVPDQNHIIRMERKTRRLEIIADAEGPCHGCAGYADGRIFISTGVEGGKNELDHFARLKEIRHNRVVDIYRAKKDLMPLIMQYGVMRFPLGTENTDQVVFTMMALTGGGEKVVHYEQ